MSGAGLKDFLLSLSFTCLCGEPTKHGRRITHPECPVHEKEAFRELVETARLCDPSIGEQP